MPFLPNRICIIGIESAVIDNKTSKIIGIFNYATPLEIKFT